MTITEGRRKFTCDIWSDGVSVAQPMEAASKPGCINASEAAYHPVGYLFDLEPRGGVEAWNKGRLAMYLLNRIKPELSADPEGLTANARFAAERQRIGNASGP